MKSLDRHIALLQHDSWEVHEKLQEKNEEIERLTNELNQCMIDHNKLLDRIDKAIDYIETKWIKDSYYDDVDNCLMFMEFNEYEKEEIINILQGVDKE